MSYRQIVNEIDLSSFVTTSTNETGAMVIKSSKGLYKYCTSEADVLTAFGKPSADYPEVFEALSFCRKAPAHIFSAIGTGALYGGIDVSISGVAGFTAGRDIATFDFASYPTLSHVFFAKSPYADDLAGKITYVSGKKFKLTLYKILSTGNSSITTYNYSLIKEKDGFGKSLYYGDVFRDNDYVQILVNSDFVYTNYNISGVTAIFAGGTRGAAPVKGDYTSKWQNFAYKTKYPAKIFMDCNGEHAVTLNTLIQTYQPYAHGISTVPMGNSAADAVTYRQGLSLDTSNVSIYTNWVEIVDDYNNSYAWISDIGSVGGKYALMSDVYDAEAPSGIDELKGQRHGGQLTSWSYIQAENDYNDTELQNLNEAQINPIIIDPNYGRMIYGNRTLQVTNSSLSFVGTRRMYNYIINIILTQILKQQEFRMNDAAHRDKARSLTDNVLLPIKNAGYLNDYYVVCDTTNNTTTTMDQRQFILTVYLQPTPDSEFTILNMVYLGQSVDISLLVSGN
jgi:hypothetical protein